MSTPENDKIHHILHDAGSRWRDSQQRVPTADLGFAVARPNNRWLPVAAAAATVGVATAAVLLAHSTGAGPHPTPGSGGSPSPTGAASASPTVSPAPAAVTVPVPAGFTASDLTFVSASVGWAVGSAPSGPVLAHTTDGGAHWGALTAPPAGATHVRFASSQLGFAFGDVSHPLFAVTTDGGNSWTSAPGASTEAVEPGASGTVRIVRAPSCSPPGCPYTIETAPPGSSTFTPLSAPALSGNAVRLARAGSDVYLLVLKNPAGGAGDAHPQVVVSHDGGATWAQRSDPCSPASSNSPAESDAAAVSAAPGGLVTLLCVDRSGGASGRLVGSADAARTFDRSAALPGAPAGGSSAALALADAAHVATVVLANGQAELMSSADSGKHWLPVAKESVPNGEVGAGFLGFTTPSVGTWLGPDASRVWRTTDGVRWSTTSGFAGS